MKINFKNSFHILLTLLLCSLYMPPFFYTLFTSLLIILSAIALFSGEKAKWKNTLPWIFISFFAAHVIGFTISDNYSGVWKGIQPKLSFLLLPFILMVFHNYLSRKFLKRLILAFFFSSILFSLILISSATFGLLDFMRSSGEAFSSDLFRRFYYSSFLTQGYIHRSYLALLLGAALISAVPLIPKKLKLRLPYYGGMLFLFAIMIILQSRMVLGAFVISAGFYFSLKIITSRSWKHLLYLLAGVVTLAIFAYAFWDSPYNRFRAVEIEDYDMSSTQGEFTGSTIRFAIWENSLELISQHPILGVSYGEIDSLRLDTYEKNNFVLGADREYNSHNQLIESQLIAGLPGSLSFLGMFFMLAWIAYRRGDNHLFILSLFTLLSMATEAMFERQLAIGFFCVYILTMALGKRISRKQLPEEDY